MRKIVKMVALIIMVMMLFAVNGLAAPKQATEASDELPLLFIDYVPEKYEYADIRGHICMPDGTEADSEAYHISVYLQVMTGGKMWVKPFSDMTYQTIDSDGDFWALFITGGRDIEAAYLHVLLIPSSYTPTSNFDSTLRQAVDYATIVRDMEGNITVTYTRAEHLTEEEGTIQ